MRFLLILTLLMVGAPVARAEVNLFAGPSVMAAVNDNNAAALTSALMGGANPNTKTVGGRTVLIEAVSKDRYDMARILLDKRADANRADDLGNTALHYASDSTSPEMISLLLGHGARLDIPNRQGLTPLMLAAKAGRADLAEVLLEAGADPKRLDFTGRSAAEWAADGRDRVTKQLFSER